MAAPKAPKGAKSDKEWRDAVRAAVHEVRKGDKSKTRTLRLLARKLVDKALEGDMTAMKEIGDRLDGRPAQAMALTDEGGGPLTVQIVRHADDTPSGT